MRDLFALDPDVTFLNHGSFGACPKAVLEKQAQLRAQLEAEPVRFFLRELEPLLDEAKRALGHFVHARPSDLAFVPNTTHAVNEVLRSLELEPGDEVLTTSHVYNACANAMRFVCERAQAKLVIVDVPFPITGQEQFTQPVLDAVTGKTRFALLDHVTSPTALVFDVAQVAKDLEARGVVTFIDGAHAPGMLELDVPSIGASYYAGNLHKWTCAPKGAAFLWARKDRQNQVRPMAISHGANSLRTDRSRYELEHDWTGTDDPTPYLSVPSALEAVAKLAPGGWPGVRATNRAMAVEARAMLLSTLRSAPPCPDAMLGSMATVPLPAKLSGGTASSVGGISIDGVQDLLFHKYRIEVPVFFFGGQRCLRISAQRYNAWGDYEKLAHALAELNA